MRAIWKNTVIAQSDDVEEIDGNFYFPLDSIKKNYFIESSTKSSCPWKGQASYFHILIDGEVNEDSAWYYSGEESKVAILKDRVAFWKGVELKESSFIGFELLSVLNSFF
ncbi:MAG TPA: DUF427 domain-containing protein [Cytophagaceae bacterium]